MADTAPGSDGSCLEKMKSYAKTQKGLILVAEILISFIATICFAVNVYGSYFTLGIFEMILAAIFFWVFMMELDKTFRVINWFWTDFFRAAGGAGLYLIFSLIWLIRMSHHNSYIAPGIFSLIAGVVFAFDTYSSCLIINRHRQESPEALV